MSEIIIHPYNNLEGSYTYEPPPEIKTLVGKGIRSKIYQIFGPLELTQKIIGYIPNNTHLMTFGFVKKVTQEMREELKKHDFDSTNDVFNHPYPREQFGDETCAIAPCDGFLSHQKIGYGEKEGYMSRFLDKIDIDINKMLGINIEDIKVHNDSYSKEESEKVIEKLWETTKGLGFGIHDLSILKPEDKHIISVPMDSTVKMIYRIDRDGALYPVETNKISIGKGRTYSTDPENLYHARNEKNRSKEKESNKGKGILDGNPRMVFVLTTNIDGEDLEYIMVAHSASLVRGVEALKKEGDTIKKGEYLFKFHFGSSVSTLYPERFKEFREVAPNIEENSQGQNLLKVLEGEVLYIPKNISKKENIKLHKNHNIDS